MREEITIPSAAPGNDGRGTKEAKDIKKMLDDVLNRGFFNPPTVTFAVGKNDLMRKEQDDVTQLLDDVEQRKSW